MNRYLKLLNFEYNRFSKTYLALLGLTVVLQVTGVFVRCLRYMNKANTIIAEQKISIDQYTSKHAPINFVEYYGSSWFLGPIAICAVIMGLYIFVIWYRDWFGKSTFIYRLLMLPTNRLIIYFSKATVIFLSVLGLVAFQIILIPIEFSLFKALIPQAFRASETNVVMLTQNSQFINILITPSILQFILFYLIGFMMVFILFTGILFERSYRLKGIGLGLLYVVFAVLLFLSPFILVIRPHNYLYPLEILGVEIVLGLALTACSIGVSAFLLKRKMTV